MQEQTNTCKLQSLLYEIIPAYLGKKKQFFSRVFQKENLQNRQNEGSFYCPDLPGYETWNLLPKNWNPKTLELFSNVNTPIWCIFSHFLTIFLHLWCVFGKSLCCILDRCTLTHVAGCPVWILGIVNYFIVFVLASIQLLRLFIRYRTTKSMILKRIVHFSVFAVACLHGYLCMYDLDF